MCNDPEYMTGEYQRQISKGITDFIMPTKRREDHAHVGPRHCHARYVRLNEPQEGVRDNRYVV